MVRSLIIYKETATNAWKFVDSIDGTYGGNDLRVTRNYVDLIVRDFGKTLNYTYTKVQLYNIGVGPETFASSDAIIQRLAELGFRNFSSAGDPAGSSITVVATPAALPPAASVPGKFYWTESPAALYYSNGTSYETIVAGDHITVVANYSALPAPATVSGQFFWATSSQGTSWLPGSLGGTYYSAGMYYSNGTSYSFLDVPYNATQTEVNTGTNNNKFITPFTFANASKWLNYVLGPSSATDNAIARFDATTGKLLQDSKVFIDDNGGIIVTGVSGSTYTGKKIEYDNNLNQWIAYDNDSNVALNLGYENWFLVTNNTGSSIPNGSVVYISGSAAGIPTIALAKADVGATAVGIGITTEAIANGATGKVTQSGLVNGMDTSALTAGAVYVSPTVAGGLTNTAPTAPNYRMRVGFVGIINATTGTVLVTPSTAAFGSGTANQIEGRNAAGTAQEQKTISGTASQILVTNTAGVITFSFTSTIVVPTGSTATTPTANDYSSKIATTNYVDRKMSWVRIRSAYIWALAATTSQKMFNGGTSGNGSFTLLANSTYTCECYVNISGLSSTSGTVTINFGGTVGIASFFYQGIGGKSSTATFFSVPSATGIIVATASGSTMQRIWFKATLETTTAGSFIPLVSASVLSATAQTDPGSEFIMIWQGLNTDTSSPDVT